jgi:hypothetical protein
MANGVVLELSTLPARHPPMGEALLQMYAPQAMVRLCIDPTPQPAGTMSREIEVDWLRHPGKEAATHQQRAVGWTGLEHHLNTLCVQLLVTVNDRTLTEQAAVGVLALLISDLEGAVLQTVLQIGSGGDYLIRRKGQVPSSRLRSAG